MGVGTEMEECIRETIVHGPREANPHYRKVENNAKKRRKEQLESNDACGRIVPLIVFVDGYVARHTIITLSGFSSGDLTRFRCSFWDAFKLVINLRYER